MKRILSVVLLLAMCLSLFAGCNQEKPSTSNLEAAKKYLEAMYQSDPVDTASDYTLAGVVTIEGVEYTVEWTTDYDKIVITRGENKMVTIDVPAGEAEAVKYVLTATISDADGNKTTATFNRRVPASASAGKSDEDIVNEAYELEDGEIMDGVATLTGVITMVKTPYDEGYQNITVIIQVGDLTDKRIECYRLTGDGAADLCAGDTITVTGTLKNYSGTIEFDAGCNLDKVVPGDRVTAPTDPKEIVAAAYALNAGDSLPYSCSLTGKVTTIDTPYDSGYKNVSFTIEVEGCEDKPILCYRAKGDDAANVAEGDIVTVSGIIINYNGTIEFTAGGKVVIDTKGEGGDEQPADPDAPFVKPTTPKEIVDAAYALEKGATLKEGPYTLTGKITKVDTPYSDQYNNITVTIAVSGRDSKPIQCYRLKGTGVEKLAVGDTITVTGDLINYNGKVQFNVGNLDKVVEGPKAPTDPKAIVDAAYALESGKQLDYQVTLTGKIVKLNVPYDSEYKNMNVTIAVAGKEDKPILCYRMKGDGLSNDLCVGDTITVTGTIKNYNGTIEFDSGCIASNIVSGGTTKPTSSKAIVDAGFALAEGESLAYFATLTGKVTEIKEAYSEQYKNVTLYIEVEGSNGAKSLMCYRMKGDAAGSVAVGDTITVTGLIKNHYGTIEFDSGCTAVFA
ncbi:MAG: hypothetical protein IJW14_01705 [Oscillospiraceae bacterium]|nr:hypothetical protein [Oscillospiraceae bacterium]